MTEKQDDGPTLEQYIETRLNLLTAYIDKMEHTVLEKVEALDRASVARYSGVRQEVEHARELLQLAQDNSRRAVDKAEAAQSAHNVASNEWRGTLNDFKSTLIGRPEFERFYSEFSAYRLESARINSLTQGEKVGTRETKETGMALFGMIGAAVGAVVTIIVSLGIAFIKPSIQAPSPPQVVVVPSPAPTEPK